ncbi:MAG: hypothetical protein NW223_10425 [Hyphomicrobiaceae bacterium]|nr:hypothetical protein [Hyphomicrobiaceae bacterium]
MLLRIKEHATCARAGEAPRPIARLAASLAAGLALACAVSLGGCATAGSMMEDLKTNAPAPTGRRAMCVASTLGSMFTVTSLGITALTTERWDIPVDGWQIDDHVRRRVHEMVGARFDVHHITAPPNAFHSLDQPGALFRNFESERADIVRRMVYGERCDYVLVVMRGSSAYGTTTQTVTGYGIIRSGDGVVIDQVYVHALGSLVLYENHSFKILAEKKLGGSKGLFTTLSGPHKKVDKSAWPQPLGSADNPSMKATVTGLIDQGLTSTVPDVVAVK